MTCNWHCTKGSSEQTTSLALSAAENVLLPISSPISSPTAYKQ